MIKLFNGSRYKNVPPENSNESNIFSDSLEFSVFEITKILPSCTKSWQDYLAR